MLSCCTGLFAYSIIERRLFNAVAGEFIQCVNEREGETCHLSEEPEILTSISRVIIQYGGTRADDIRVR